MGGEEGKRGVAASRRRGVAALCALLLPPPHAVCACSPVTPCVRCRRRRRGDVPCSRRAPCACDCQHRSAVCALLLPPPQRRVCVATAAAATSTAAHQNLPFPPPSPPPLPPSPPPRLQGLVHSWDTETPQRNLELLSPDGLGEAAEAAARARLASKDASGGSVILSLASWLFDGGAPGGRVLHLVRGPCATRSAEKEMHTDLNWDPVGMLGR